ncbi:bacillithiol biosynthesis cysteine-adding enzyme BshC [Schinkia azotoformans]|uniref:bacillithiol biosynthesis cysteine-adding enzyme BshC n=1 Tax=Schinkia azotoformans TaxID=1454 RepID=UPI002DC03F7B|nr:bacillithiol biosynthesis cysteine-adding enzyme BshC [Schinkia azotoformans]MEC1715403.1 bacillithiol biosynthesis cysteine-adding enzyme BshC [Schinkia azotoformans]MEC1740847.1 bacillithiol biosynthesis cysteine-adding enzyme BshC [Schinkia azotoformans]MEC1746597.1 bacillithiol biosynthesis cysteine-adding enzyme BshC [Schinkia azotoformans]MEC1767804.1 bacillithiol biosynthesis cysteine-adding enzyme BshC [Schinkia azotoformans]MEC1786128.1 bacillithiol biosynthesis cysteine-adding enz
MEIQDVSQALANKIASSYISGEDEAASFFDYPKIQNEETYKKRLEELSNRQFPRQELVDYLLEFHKNFDASDKTISNIKRMLDPKSVVVIGGQQAGLLTGPLYSIHKIISIIKFAKEQEELLNVPVLPVFWVAGEDHDFAEINHTYVLHNGRVEKRAIKQKHFKKSPASKVIIDQNKAEDWIKEIIGTFGETIYTNDILNHLYDDLRKSSTYVDFFINIVFRLFKDHGLIIVDSGDAGFRKIGSPFMETIIRNNSKLGEKVLCGQLTLKELGYGQPIEMNEHNAHLFLIHDGERILLERFKTQFVGKNKECYFEHTALLELNHNQPELFSNNVATRPLMQEYVFPTLAFISGPGEIAYWAALKKAFHLFGFKVPPVIPRLMISILDRKTEKYVKELGLDIAKVVNSGCQNEREDWLKKQQPFPIEQMTEETITQILNAHRPFKELAIQVDPHLKDLAEKNAELIQSQIYYLKQKMEKSIRFQHKVELDKFDHINHFIKPLNAPQERIWNIFYYINLYGYQIIDEMLDLNYQWNNQHKVITI